MCIRDRSYCDYSTYLPECKDIVEQLATMIHEILETSKINMAVSYTHLDVYKRQLGNRLLPIYLQYRYLHFCIPAHRDNDFLTGAFYHLRHVPACELPPQHGSLF